MTFNPDGIPDELKRYPNWVLWKYAERDGKMTKVPFDPKRTWKGAKSNDPATWGTWEQIMRAYARGGFSGIGFQFSHSPFFGVDTDHKPYGEGIHELAGELLLELGTYTEFSPSMMGQHAIGRGSLPSWATNKKQLAEDLEIEVYSEGRFFTITGERVFDFELSDAQEPLERLLRSQGMEKAAPVVRSAFTGQTGAFTGSDAELWERIFTSANGGSVRALADGDLSQHGGDHSKADFALCSHLAFWCNGDTARMDSMFRSSGLMRPKWDAKHYSDGSTYGEGTIRAVLDRWDGEGYDPSRKRTLERHTERVEWSAPEVLLRGRQHLASSGGHGRTVNSYSALWQATVHVVTEGHTERDDTRLIVTPYGMTELYAHAGGRPMDRRQQLQFLHSQGMVGPLIRQDPSNPKSVWLLTMPLSPSNLPFWTAGRSLCRLPLNAICRPNQGASQSITTVNNYNESISANKPVFPVWALFSLAVLGVGTTAEISDLSGVSERTLKRQLGAFPLIVQREGRCKGQRWRSVLDWQQVGQLYLSLTADQVEKRRRRILEDRLDFHEQKFRYLSSCGLTGRASFPVCGEVPQASGGSNLMKLRDYQIDAINRLRTELRNGHKRVILQALTGLGKTVVASAMIKSARDKKNVTLFVAHRRELIKQASDKLEKFGIRHGVVMPGYPQADGEFVYVGTVQSFVARMRRGKFAPGDVKLIIFDEAHRSPSDTYQTMLTTFPGATVIGLTATPTRGDEKGLGDTYSAMVSLMSYEEAFEKGYLVRPKYYAPFVPDLENARTRAGDYAEEDLEAEMNKPSLTGDIVSHYARHARLPDGSLRQGVCFGVNVRHSIALAAAFNAAGIVAAHVDGETPTKDRDEINDAYERGEYDMLCSVGIHTEGWDMPQCSAVVLACPTKSVIKHLQTAGRALRPHPESGKTDAIILDHAGNLLRLGALEEYKEWTLEKGSEYTASKKKKDKKDPKEITCDSCGHLFYSAKLCPSCGHEHVIERSPKEVEVAEGDLVELGSTERKKYSQDEKKRWWSMMLYLAHMENRRPGYAYYAYKAKFGCGPGPWQKQIQSMPADEEVRGWWQHYKIRQREGWKKAQQAQSELLGNGNAAD